MLFGKNKDTRRELVGAFEAVEGIRIAENRDETNHRNHQSVC